MLAAVIALVVSQAVLAVLLFGTAAMDRSLIDGVVERHPLLPRGWRQRRTLRAHRRRLDRLGVAVERAARLGSG
jgi:hypothetical protein